MSGEICPVPACGASRRRGHAMCRSCWGTVPRAAQTEVYRTWRAFQAAASPELRLRAIGAYRAALVAAIAAVVARR